MKKFTIATRGSQLALWQANHIKNCLEQKHTDLQVELLCIKTKGDIILDVPLAKVGGKGLFVKEIEEALLNGTADLAVHSMKDVPMELPEGLFLCCIPEREICADVILSMNYASIDELPQNAHVGTSSLRRQAQLLHMRPDLRISSLRGNVDTRLKKLTDGQYDAIVLAGAGLKRLGLSAPHMFYVDTKAFLPAAGQGALGIECSAARQDVIDALSFLEHAPTRICVEAERAFLTGLEGGCQVPIAAHATMEDPEHFVLEGLVAEVDGSTIIRQKIRAHASESITTGTTLAKELLARGAQEILQKLYTHAAD